MKAIFSLLACALPFGICGAAAPAPENFILETHAPGLARVEVRITAEDIKEPLMQSLEASDGAVAKGIRIPPGARRVVEAALFDAKAGLLAQGKVVADIPEKGSASVRLHAAPVKDGEAIAVSLS